MTDQVDPHRGSRSEALTQKARWEDLLKSPAWSMVARFLADQKKMRIVRLLTEPDVSDKELHFLRGEAATFELIEKYPEAMLDVQNDVLNTIRSEDGRPDELPASIDDVDLPPTDDDEPTGYDSPGSIGNPAGSR